MVINLITGGGILDSLEGIIAGHLYFFLKDVLPIQKGIDVLKTPKFLVDYFMNRIPVQIINNQRNQNNTNNNNRNNDGGNDFRNRNDTNNNSRGYVPFSGRGYRLD